jgi:hypothetical protein
MSYIDVRTADGRLLFRFDPDRLLVAIRARGEDHVVDLTLFPPSQPQAAVVEYDPLANLSMNPSRTLVQDKRSML